MAVSPGRRVSVELVLETARFLRGGVETEGIVRKVSASIEELGDEVDEAGRDMDQLALNTAVAKKSVDDLGDKALTATVQLKVLEHQLHATGRAASGMDLTPDAGGMAAGAGGGGAAGRRAIETTSSFDLPRLRTAMFTTLISGAVMASPIIGAMIAGAITGAVGLGGIAGGIGMASKDPRVRAAARNFGDDIAEEFFSGGAAFVQPTIDSLNLLEDAFKDMDLGGSFAKLAPHVTTIAAGLGNLGRNIMPGLNEMFDRFGPFAAVLADGFGDLGTQIGDFFNRLSRSQGAVMGLESAFDFLNGSIKALGVILEFLSNRYVEFIDFIIFTSGVLEDLPLPGQENMRRLNDEFTEMRNRVAGQAPAVNQAAGEWRSYTEAIEDANRAMEDNISLMLAQDNANLGLAEAMADFGETLEENGRHWDTSTEKGRANTRGLLDAVGAAERKRQADIRTGIQMGLSAEEASNRANTAYNKTIAKLRDMAIRAGLTGKALDDLVGDYYVNVHIRTSGSFYTPPKSVLEQKGRAAGGPVDAGELYRVNELGMEWFRPNVSGEVIPLSGMQASGGWGGMAISAQPFVLNIPGHRAFQDLFDQVVREVGDRGGTLAVIGIRE